MLATLPFFSYVLLVFGLWRRNRDWREALLFATIPCGLFVAVATEALSAFHWITRIGVAFAWLGFLSCCLIWALKAGNRRPREEDAIEEQRDPLSAAGKIGLYGVVVIAAVTFLTALVSAPNTWDVMEYHLPRVIEWMSFHGVQLYPTIDRQQLSMPPFAEYAMLHLDLLYGSDRLVNLVQWLSSIGCILTVSLIARLLGANRETQIFSALLTATLPSGILGASSAKNDYVLAYWIALSVYLLLRWKTQQSWASAGAIASAVTLAVFTKGTAYAFLPFLFLACAASWDRAAMRRFAVRIPAMALLLVAVNAPLWMRNFRFSGSIFGLPYFDGAGPVFGRLFANSHITPARTLANVLRSIGLNLGVPSQHINRITTSLLSHGIAMLGVNPNDPGQLVIGQSGLFRPFAVAFASRQEALTGNTLHLLLFIAALLGCFFLFREVNREVLWLGGGLIGAFVLYSALLRWSPFNARYQLPLFVLSAVFIAMILIRILPPKGIAAISALLLLASIPPAFANQTRPLFTKHGLRGSILAVPRDQTYFFDQHQTIADSFIAAARAASATQCKSIGVDAGRLHFEYPLFALLRKYGGAVNISYAGVDNPTAAYKPPLSEPTCAIICLECAASGGTMAEYGSAGSGMQTFGDVVLFSSPGSEAAGQMQSKR